MVSEELSLIWPYLKKIGLDVNDLSNYRPVTSRALFLVQYCSVYTGTLAFFLEAHGVSYHFFADDTQIYIRVEDIDEAKHRLSSLLSDLKIWMARGKLKLNDGKTEIIVIRGNLRNVSVANFGVMSFGDTQLVPCVNLQRISVLSSILR